VDGFKNSYYINEFELPGPPNECFTEVSPTPNFPTDFQQSPTNLTTVEPLRLDATPNQPCQSSMVNQFPSQAEKSQKSQKSNGFIKSISQQVTNQRIWLPSADASPGLGPQFPAVSVVLGTADDVLPPRARPTIIPKVTSSQQVPIKHSAPAAPNRGTQKLISAPLASANTQIKEIESLSKRPASFDSCINVFETTPGALTKVKRRRKLDPTSHKSFKVTRKIGSCLECRFRKRPVRFFLYHTNAHENL
jgi:hypothetical protein